MKVFIDTSAYIALIVKSEVTHSKVVQVFKSFRNQRALFFTSDYILDELYTRLAYDHRPLIVKRCMRLIDQATKEGELKVLAVDSSVFVAAKKVFSKHLDLALSFTDATSIVFVRTYRLDEVFTLDRDFRKVRLPVPAELLE